MPPANQSASDNGAPPAGDNSANASVNSRLEASGAEATTVATTTVPARLDSLKWILVGGFASIFALGFIYLFRRPQVMAPTNGDAPAIATVATEMAYSPASKPTPTATETVAEVTRAVTGSLDELKDSLFRLELRRQAGTITEDDYDRERRQMEKVLRDLVRG